ncbi:MAG: YhgE/Pip domain-containing protein [Cellulosilyticaceae bacterium]
MHFIWSNYKQDLKNIFTNAITLITVIGLVLLPSLYAWFNIAANWDPYSATKGIKVAVVNLDQGSTVGDKPINLVDTPHS